MSLASALRWIGARCLAVADELDPPVPVPEPVPASVPTPEPTPERPIDAELELRLAELRSVQLAGALHRACHRHPEPPGLA